MAGDILEAFGRLKLPTQAQIDGLRRCGVPTQALIFDWCGAPVAIKRAFVEWIPDGRFAFEDESVSGVVVDSLVVIANDQCDDPADLIAFDLNGRFGSWLGVPVLGLETACLPRMSDALPVFRHPIDWLSSFRKGVVVLNPKKARHYLENAGAFVVASTEHGKAISEAMTYRPKIYVNSERAAA